VGEGDAIFGSVTAVEVVEAIKMQTGRELDKKAVTLPEIKSLGTYEATGELLRRRLPYLCSVQQPVCRLGMCSDATLTSCLLGGGGM
jgi:hypothetical protein